MEKQQNLCFSYELARNNRFIVRFPEKLNVPEWLVITSTLPVDKRNGIITVTLRVPVLLDTDKERPYLSIEDFNMSIELLNQTGLVLSKYDLTECKIIDVKNSLLNYENYDIITSSIKIYYKDCTPDGNVICFISNKIK